MTSVVPTPLQSLALGATFSQVGIVVPDLDRALEAHGGMGPWSVWTYGPALLDTLEVDGKSADFAFRVALDPHTPQVELIQPLDDRSPYAHWMERHGPGIHHLGYHVDDLDLATETMQRAGVSLLMRGTGHGADGKGGFAYFDTIDTVGYITEAIERPGERHPPEALHP